MNIMNGTTIIMQPLLLSFFQSIRCLDSSGWFPGPSVVPGKLTQHVKTKCLFDGPTLDFNGKYMMK